MAVSDIGQGSHLWPIFLLLGMENVPINPRNTAFTLLDFYDYPISHSLVTAIGRGALLHIIDFMIRQFTQSAWVQGAGVVSHWILAAISHRPDMPLAPDVAAHVKPGLQIGIVHLSRF